MTDNELIDAALAVICTRPLPSDAQARLSAIGNQLATEESKNQMGDIWEGFIAAGGVLTHPDSP